MMFTTFPVDTRFPIIQQGSNAFAQVSNNSTSTGHTYRLTEGMVLEHQIFYTISYEDATPVSV